MNIAKIIGAGPLIVIDTEVDGAHKSKPSYSFFMSSNVQILTPLILRLSHKYPDGDLDLLRISVTESNAVDKRFASSSFDK